MTTELDSLSKLYRALVEALQTEEMLRLIPAGNWIIYDSDDNPDPYKETRDEADFPEIEIEPGSASAALITSSTGGSITPSFLIKIDTNDYRVHAFAYPILLAALQALSAWTEQADLQLPFVTDIKVSGILQRASDPKANRNAVGWQVQITVNAVCNFERVLGQLRE